MRYFRTTLFASSQALVGFLVSLYVSSLSDGKVLVIGEILSSSANVAILTHPLRIVSALGAINVVIFFIASYTGKIKAERKIYEKMCQHIFDEYIRNNPLFEVSDCKVSLLMVKKNQICRTQYGLKLSTCLVVVGRYQTKQGYSRSNVRFVKGEGCAGLAYKLNLVVNNVISNYNKINIMPYLQDCENTLNLPAWKAKRLNEKPSSIICIPINTFGTDTVVGVLSLDSLKGTKFEEKMVTKIQKTVSSYRPFFHEIKP